MEAVKQGLFEKMQQKGTTVSQVADAIGFDAQILNLYFANDAFPLPKRIVEKISTQLAA